MVAVVGLNFEVQAAERGRTLLVVILELVVDGADEF